MLETSSMPVPPQSRRHASDPGAGRDRNILECFAEQVARHGDRAAVQGERDTCTYAELDGTANRIAQALLARASGDDAGPVALLIEPGPAHVAAILGSLKAGRPYLPLDPHQPAARQAEILKDSGASMLLCDAVHADHARQLATARVSALEIEPLRVRYPASDPNLVIAPAAPANLLYTSGSTGTPKGVLASHRATVHNALTEIGDLGLAPTDRTALFLSTAHGLAASLTLHTLLSGGTLLTFDLRRNGLPALASWLERERASVVKITPSVARRLFASLLPQQTFAHFRYLWFGGEPLYGADLARVWPHVAAACRIVVGLNSTETKEICRRVIDRDAPPDGGPVAVGRPVGGKRVQLLDEGGREVAPGELGELWVRSRFLADGYWGDPELTRARFFPVAGDTDERRFRSGDLARQLPDGMLELCGRRDAQLKIRGFRVEPEEAAAALRRLNGVKEAAVIVDRAGGEPRMAGYVVADGAALDAGEVRRRLAAEVPDYLVPARLTVVPALPVTTVGKLDVDGLRALPGADLSGPDPGGAPRTRTESILLKAARSLLPGAGVGLDRDFFAAGGDSLAAAALLVRVEQIFQVRVAPGDFAAHRTLAWLATRVEALRARTPAARDRPDSLLVPLAGPGSGTPIFFVPGGGGSEIELFLANTELSAALGRERPVLGFRATAPDGRLQAGRTVAEIAESFLGALRDAQPRGPYALLGECFGARVAMEMARRLAQRHEAVFLVVLDAHPTRRILPWVHAARRLWRRKVGLARMVADRVRHHLRASASLPVSRRGAHLLGKVPVAAVLVRDADRRNYHPERDISRRIEGARETYKRILLGFRPRPYAGPLTVLLSDSYLRDRVDTAWRRFAGRNLTVQAMPGDHYSAFRRYAADTARLVLEGFAAQERACASRHDGAAGN